MRAYLVWVTTYLALASVITHGLTSVFGEGTWRHIGILVVTVVLSWLVAEAVEAAEIARQIDVKYQRIARTRR